MSYPDLDILRDIAKKHLTLREIEDFELCLERFTYERQHDLGHARWYVMQAIESHHHRGHINEETAQTVYTSIGLCPVKKTAPAHVHLL